MMNSLMVGLLLLVAGAEAAPEETPAPKPRYEPTCNYTVREICGWKVYVNNVLLGEQRRLGRQTLRLLRTKLYEIHRTVPKPAVEKMQTIPIWVEWRDRGFPCACYHVSRDWLAEHGYNPEKARSVEIANAAAFLDWTHEQPSMVLHELAHGYHDIFLGGYDNADLKKAWQRAVDDKSYEQVLHWDGKTVRAYALNNPQEYFAELSEAWFGTNDFYPFVRAEVRKHDPEAARLLPKLWGEQEP